MCGLKQLRTTSQLKMDNRIRQVTKDDMQITNWLIKYCSMSLFIRQMEIKVTMTHHQTHVKMRVLRKK